jgi:hypothetical protein
MKHTALLLSCLLTLGIVSAQEDDMSGGTMSGGAVMNQEVGEGDVGMPVEAPAQALAQTGGMMTGGMMSGGAMMDQSLEVTLSGDQEVPPVTTEGMGSATVSLMGDTMTVSGDFSGLSSPAIEIAGTPGHIHMAPPGENGDVVFPLNVSVDESGTSGIFSLSTTLTPEQIDAFNAGELYFNFHTEANQGGEIRGQITPGM